MPQSASEVAELIGAAARDGACVVPHADERRPPEARSCPLICLDLSGVNSIIDHAVADQILQVQPGIKIVELNRLLAGKGQFLPVCVPASWTLLDALLYGESGALEHGFGGMRNLVLGATAILADGTVTKCGGRVVKNVSGYDVVKLIIGSHGWLAIPVSCFLRLYAAPETSLTLGWSFDSLWQMMNCAQSLIRSGLPFAALEAVGGGIVNQASGRFLLLAQILALQSVGSEIETAACEIAGSPELVRAGEESRALWADIAERTLSVETAKALKVVAAPTAIPDIINALPPASLWSARISTGKLTVVAPSAGETLSALSALSKASNQPITVACADRQYNYRVHQLPYPDANLLRLKQSIKQAFDPNSTYNPFVLP